MKCGKVPRLLELLPDFRKRRLRWSLRRGNPLECTGSSSHSDYLWRWTMWTQQTDSATSY